MRVPTINDVAKLAGVSKRTVSRVINDQGAIKVETRNRVLQAVKALDYTPNVLARRLAQGRTEILGVFAYETAFPTEREDFFYPFLEGIETEAQRQQYDLLLLTHTAELQVAGNARSIYPDSRGRLQLADGLILLGSNTNRDDLVKLSQENVLFVTIGRRAAGNLQTSWVSAAYTPIYYDVTSRLIGLGHRRIGMVVSDPTFEADMDKLAGYRRALIDAGIRPDSNWVVRCSDAKSIADKFLQQSEPVTAILHSTNTTCVPLYQELKSRNIAVPEDMSLVSFDQSSSQVDGMQLAYIQMPKQEMGRRAVSLLVSQLKQVQQPQVEHILLPCEFVLGQSIGLTPNS